MAVCPRDTWCPLYNGVLDVQHVHLADLVFAVLFMESNFSLVGSSKMRILSLTGMLACFHTDDNL